MRSLALIFMIFAAPLAQAQGIQKAVHPNYSSPHDMMGLCTADNKKNHYYKSGHCLSILEKLRGKDCVKDKLEEIRLRYLGDVQKMKAAKLKNQDGISFGGISCVSKNNPGEQNLKKLAEDPDQFAIVMMQLFAAIIIEESKWRVNHNGNTSQSQSVKCTVNCGLFGLNKADMEKPKYQCGCKIPNKTDGQQYDPTMDGHLNLTCGITMALVEATDAENTDLLGGGDPKSRTQAEDKRNGFARIFKSLESAKNKSETPDDAMDTPKKRIYAKMRNYCETQAFASKNVNEWKRQLQDSKDASSLK